MSKVSFSGGADGHQRGRIYMNDMILRPVNPSKDYLKIFELIDYGVDEGGLLPRTLDEIKSSPFFFVCEDNGKIVGCVSLEIYSPRLAEVRSLYVLPAYRKQRLGYQLIERCINESKRREIKEVLAVTDKIDLFKRSGFDSILNGQQAMFVKL